MSLRFTKSDFKCFYFRIVFDIKNMLLLELFPNVAKLLGISMVNIKFEKVI